MLLADLTLWKKSSAPSLIGSNFPIIINSSFLRSTRNRSSNSNICPSMEVRSSRLDSLKNKHNSLIGLLLLAALMPERSEGTPFFAFDASVVRIEWATRARRWARLGTSLYEFLWQNHSSYSKNSSMGF